MYRNTESLFAQIKTSYTCDNYRISCITNAKVTVKERPSREQKLLNEADIFIGQSNILKRNFKRI